MIYSLSQSRAYLHDESTESMNEGAVLLLQATMKTDLVIHQ